MHAYLFASKLTALMWQMGGPRSVKWDGIQDRYCTCGVSAWRAIVHTVRIYYSADQANAPSGFMQSSVVVVNRTEIESWKI